MLLKDIAFDAGEHRLMLKGAMGNIECIYSVPQNQHYSQCAIIGHPHSLQGGTMDNKVVTMLARIFKDLNIATMRFNFRGVGETQGVYDSGLGESEDMINVAQQIKEVVPDVRFILAGFSFGTYVSFRAALTLPHDVLISIAPPVERFNYFEKASNIKAWLVVQGDKDEVVNPQKVRVFFDNEITAPQKLWLYFEDTGHFFHSKLILLKERLTQALLDMMVIK